MTRQKLLYFVCIFASINCLAQTFDYNGKAYRATDSWEFLCDNYALTGSANVQIAKTEKGGLLKLTVETTDPNFIISGMVYVFLTDNTIITCSDKAMRDTSGNKVSSYYTFSPIEMNKLKMTEIQSIHFNINGKTHGFSSQIGNFTAVNRKRYFSTAFDRSKKSYATTEEIGALYK